MNKIETSISAYGQEGQVNIYFYRNNSMPALLLEDAQHQLIDDLTTNHRLFVDEAVSIRSDEPNSVKLLKDAGWITGEPVKSIPSGFISIDYYELTDAALELVRDRAKLLKEDYPC